MFFKKGGTYKKTKKMAISDVNRKIAAFALLVCLQCALLLVMKKASQDAIASGSDTAFKFSPSACIAVAEFIKLSLSSAALSQDDHVKQHGLQTGVWLLFSEHLSWRLALTYLALGLAYALNNDLTFVLSTMADPGSIQLAKSCTPLFTALALWATYSYPMNQLQWISIGFITSGILTTQIDSCKGVPLLSLETYFVMLISVTVTTFTSVVNAVTVKESGCPLALQNIMLYTVGTIANTISHFSRFPSKGLFLGMDNPPAIIILTLNALMGLAINLVYKWANAVVKTVASCVSMAVLVFLSAFLFRAPLTVHTVSGSSVVILATYVYMRIAEPMNKIEQEQKMNKEQAENTPTHLTSIEILTSSANTTKSTPANPFLLGWNSRKVLSFMVAISFCTLCAALSRIEFTFRDEYDLELRALHNASVPMLPNNK